MEPRESDWRVESELVKEKRKSYKWKKEWTEIRDEAEKGNWPGRHIRDKALVCLNW